MWRLEHAGSHSNPLIVDGGRAMAPLPDPTQISPNSHVASGLIKTLKTAVPEILPLGSVKGWRLAICRRPIDWADNFMCTARPDPRDPAQPDAEDWRTCIYVILNGSPTNHILICTLDSIGPGGEYVPNNEDPLVEIRGDGLSAKQVQVVSDQCLPLSNLYCWGKIYASTPGLPQIYVNDRRDVFDRMAFTYDSPRVNDDESTYPNHDRVRTHLQNEALAFLPGPTGPGGLGLDQAEIPNGANWALSSWDRWETIYDALAVNDCGGAPVIATLNFETNLSKCPIVASLVMVYCRVACYLSVYYSGVDKGVYPTIVVQIDGELRLRDRSFVSGDCKYTNGSRPWGKISPGEDVPVNFGGGDCMQWNPTGGYESPFSLDGETWKLTGVSGATFTADQLRDATIPSQFKWRGFVGASRLSDPTWRSISDGERQSLAWVFCCCLARNLEAYRVEAVRTDPGVGYDQRWLGNVGISFDVGATLSERCSDSDLDAFFDGLICPIS